MRDDGVDASGNSVSNDVVVLFLFRAARMNGVTVSYITHTWIDNVNLNSVAHRSQLTRIESIVMDCA